MDLKIYSRYSGFSKPGILFYDISTLLANPEAWRSPWSEWPGLCRHRLDVLAELNPAFLVAAHSP